MPTPVPQNRVTIDSRQSLGLGLLGDRAANRVSKFLAVYAVLGTGAQLALAWVNRTREELSYTIAVRGDDAIYPDLHAWLLDRIPPNRRRGLTVFTRREAANSNEGPVPESASMAPRMKVLYDGTRAQTLTLDAQKIKVRLERPETFLRFDEDHKYPVREIDRIVFTARNLAGQQAVLRFLDEITATQAKRQPRLYMAARWSGFNTRSDVPVRPLTSIVLKPGQVEGMLDDLRRFLSAENDYNRLGVPYHRGYLLHGPPGTGKTSVAKALASHLGLDVYYIPLSAVQNDAALGELLARVEPRSILLLEDIDIAHGAKVRDDEGDGVSLSGLLNALDGFVTPHGLITVMTTNNADVLDPALLRPGRVDRRDELSYLDDEQLGRLVETMLGERFDMPSIDERQVTPATVVNEVVKHLDDVEAAASAIRQALLDGR